MRSDPAIADGTPQVNSMSSLMLDADCPVRVTSANNPLARHAMVTLAELKSERMILRLSSSATRVQFESTLRCINESIGNFNVAIEADNIAAIKDLIRKDLGVSILPKSALVDELRKGKLAALPIENLSVVPETKSVYNRGFSHVEIPQEITRIYREIGRALR